MEKNFEKEEFGVSIGNVEQQMKEIGAKLCSPDRIGRGLPDREDMRTCARAHTHTHAQHACTHMHTQRHDKWKFGGMGGT